MMTDFNVTQTFSSGLQIGFVTKTSGDVWFNDYYFIAPGKEPVGPYADEEDARRGYYFQTN